MAGKDRNLIERDGRFTTRLVIPQELRPFMDGKSELRFAHGRDKRKAIAQHPRALARFYDQLDDARRRLAEISGAPSAPSTRSATPLSPEEIARLHYWQRLAFDDEARNDRRYASVGIDDRFVETLRAAKAGTASEDELEAIAGRTIERYRREGLTDALPRTDAWRRLARIIATAEYEALARAAERDDGNFTGETTLPMLQAPPASAIEEPTRPPVPIASLYDAYLDELEKSGKGAVARRRWAPVITDLVAFLKHDDANRITKSDVIRWKDDLLTRYAPKTVRDINLASLKAVLTWAHENERIDTNPAVGVRVRLAARPQSREKGFTDEEARVILSAVRAYQPKPSANPQTRESEEMTAAKRWVPWLCAFSGARVAEITQLRKEDVRETNGIAYLRITPDAGSVKTGLYRDVPIHRQLIEVGFLRFVEQSSDGPLFYRIGNRRPGATDPSKMVATRIGRWLRTLPAMPAEVDPSHGWRHRLKTVGRELAIDPRVIDAIQGHAARTAGENYGDVTLKAKHNAIERIPIFDIK